jgi:hypothetical protein
MQAEYLNEATQYISRFGWGTQGRMLGISKMFQPNDCVNMKKGKIVVSFRPRGILSGFLAVVPALRAAIYIPPIAGKTQARLVRMRLSEEMLTDGAILSCYWDGNDLVLEDMLAMGGQSLWQTQSFETRWNHHMRDFCKKWIQDTVCQGCTIRLADYMSLEAMQKPNDREVLEFVFNAPNSKRLVWVTSTDNAEEHTQMSKSLTKFIAKRESVIGPDIFTLWNENREKIGMALVRTLEISRTLRLKKGDEFEVETTWNKFFERHEILSAA